jgi:hypothetical protein
MLAREPKLSVAKEAVIRMQSLVKKVASLRGRFWRPELFRPDAARDIFLVTYPRSGTTWISCIAAGLLFQRSPESLTEVDWLVPDVHALPEKSAVPSASQYLIKSHFPLHGASGSFPLNGAGGPFGDYRRVIYLIRDPRDVMLSYYRFFRFLSKYPGGLKEFAMDWVAGRIWPCSWQEHVNSWLAPRSRPAPFELTVLRYEDFVADPIGQTEILAKILGVDPERARIEEIVADTTPDSMRKREIKGNAGISPDLNFIGPARAGNWKGLQSQDDRDAISILEEFAHAAMQQIGYMSSKPVE